jgi:hypothetical protein
MKLIHLAVVVLVASAAVSAQWLNHPTPGIPRLPDGKPDLNAPPPRTADGKPDFSGVWQFRLPVAYMMNIVSDLQPGEIKPWADAAFRRHAADFGKDDPFTVGCLPRGPRGILGSAPGGQITKITQDRNAITILFEDMSYRQIFLDGRALPQDPDPSFMGYSVGRWEGDTLIVDRSDSMIGLGWIGVAIHTLKVYA